ncbi:MAG: MBL fold metallo-hydrolase [Mariprofundaceae bacterium]|nr:MBL fold metallo-hydrolase [Mariprofundaceae bacterium]
MYITFYGVRGSIPSPGPHTIKYGGNTSCVHIELDDHRDLIFDAGTGLRILGKHLESKTTPVNIILSHSHWDHIQGYPFFSPIYQADREITVFNSDESEHQLLCALFDQMDGSSFPVKAEKLPSQSVCVFKDAEKALRKKQIIIEKKPLNHP